MVSTVPLLVAAPWCHLLYTEPKVKYFTHHPCTHVQQPVCQATDNVAAETPSAVLMNVYNTVQRSLLCPL